MRESSFNLNTKEADVLRSMASPRGDEELGPFCELGDIAARAFPKKGVSPSTKGNSWVRNSMRKLLRLGLVKHGPGGKSGKYARTKVTLADVREAQKKVADEAAKKAAEKGAKKVKKVAGKAKKTTA